MDSLLYIGIVQSVFAAIIIFFKRPFTISDGILGGWLVFISNMFAFSIFRLSYPEVSDLNWVGDLNVLISFPPFIFLYTKYSIQNEPNFRRFDLLHFIPVLLSIIILLIVADWPLKGFAFGYNLLSSKLWLRNLLGIYLLISLWFYLYRSVKQVSAYRKQLVNLYSYQSEKNNYVWLLIVIIAFAIIFNITGVLGALNHYEILLFDVELVNKIGIVMFVYGVSFWGFRQNQILILHSDKITEQKDKKSSYEKTGLKDDKIDNYLKLLIETMEKTEIWKNPELSVSDLSHEIKVPKHYITQLLNDNLNKNFYTFVNEYRTEAVKEMLKSEDYSNWSIIAIAYECGFNSKSVFNSFFKKHTGSTPSSFKNN